MTDALEGQECLFGPDTWSGRTSMGSGPAVPRRERTSPSSSKRSSKSASRKPFIFMSVSRTEDGPLPGATTLKMEAGPWPIVPWMPSSSEPRRDDAGLLCWQISTEPRLQSFSLTLNCSEKPRNPNPTKLIQVLEEDPPDRFRLSVKACIGILNRAERRRKQLPVELKDALERQAGLK